MYDLAEFWLKWKRESDSMKVLDFAKAKEEKEALSQVKEMPIDDIRQLSHDDLLTRLQSCIDCLSLNRLFSEEWNSYRNHIDDLMLILDERLKKIKRLPY